MADESDDEYRSFEDLLFFSPTMIEMSETMIKNSFQSLKNSFQSFI